MLTIEDDGRGFTKNFNLPGLGLIGMRERAKMIGADLKIDSRPDEGSKVSLTLNLG